MNCPNHPEQELEYSCISDVTAGEVYMDASCNYCPLCLYVTDTIIEVHL